MSVDINRYNDVSLDEFRWTFLLVIGTIVLHVKLENSHDPDLP